MNTRFHAARASYTTRSNAHEKSLRRRSAAGDRPAARPPTATAERDATRGDGDGDDDDDDARGADDEDAREARDDDDARDDDATTR